MSGRKKAYLFLGLLLLILALASACAGSGTTSQIIKDVSPQEAHGLIQQNAGNADFVILDVRTPQEYAAGHIAGSVNLDFYRSDFEAGLDKLDKTRVYLVYCRSGHRSGQAVDIMRKLGFAEVYNMDGGIVDWETAGLPTVK